MNRIRYNSYKVNIKKMSSDMQQKVAQAPKFELFIGGHSFIRRWVVSCYLDDHPELDRLMLENALAETMITEEVNPDCESTSVILKQLKIDSKISKVHVMISKATYFTTGLDDLAVRINKNPGVKMVLLDIFFQCFIE